MKKIFALLAVVLAVVSCQKEINGLPVDSNNEAAVSLSVALPDDATRAAGVDSALGGVSYYNENVNLYDIRFILEVYDADGNLAKERMVKSGDATSATFNFRLIPGRNYKFVVWADFVLEDSQDDLHYDTNVEDADGKSRGLRAVAIKDWTAIDESRDAYTEAVVIEDYSGSTQIPNIVLTRPFAKLRVVTNDIKEMISVRPAIVKVNYFDTKFYTAFDAFAEQPIDKTYNGHELVVNLADDTYTEETLKNTGEQTLFADYMFAKEGDRVKFTMDVVDNGGIKLPQVVFSTDIPVNRNYLTTVYGPILTDANNVTVTIKDAFENDTNWNPKEDEYDVDIWDGKSVKEPAQDTNGNYVIYEGAELAWIADQVNGVTRAAVNTFKGKTIKLMRNINLGGQEWTPIGCAGKYFEGTFDGDDHIVGNFQITKQEGHAALFGNARATIKNLTVIDAKIVAHHYAGGIVGQGYVNMDKCHVNNIDITLSAKNGDWGDKAGGLVGQNCEGAKRITNSTAKNVKIQGYRDLGGIVGMAHNNNIVSDCYAENITILQDLSVNYQNSTPTTLGAVIGRRGTNVTESNNTTGEGIEIAVIIAEGLTQNTESGDFNVSSAEGLAYIAEQVNEEDNTDIASGDIILNGDIDLASITTFATRAAVANNWTPIGTEENPFTGTFDGNGNTIKNLALVESEAKEGKAFIGFFGFAKNATIKNVNFENVYINIPCLDIDHSQGHIGAVAGSLEGTSTIENVTVKGDVKVYATQDANGASRVAVIAGGNSYGDVTMKNVNVRANEGSYLIANNNTGALAGQLQGKLVFENCSSNINVTVNKFFAGGLVGIAAGDSTFTNCHTTGDIAVVAGREGRHNDEYRVGGIAGGWADGKTKVCTLTNCTYTGKVSGKNADGSVANPLDYAGYVGRGYTLSNCAGSKVIIDGDEYVQLYDNIYGVYTVNGAYAVNSAADLKALANLVNAGTSFEGVEVVLTADIDLKNENWTPIGSITNERGFCGNFDGRNHTIKNLTITNPALDADNYAYAGLFGITENNTIKNLTIENVNISTEGHIVAAAIAYPYYTKLENIKVKGNVNIKGGDYTAGVLAYTRRCVDAENISIEATNGSIEGNMTVGGVISDIQMNGGLTANYSNFEATGLTIKGAKCVGGISGIIANQTLDGATVKNVVIVSDDARKGTHCGSFDGVCEITNAVVENVTGADFFIGGLYEGTESTTDSVTINDVTYTYNNGWLVDGYKVLADGLLKKDNEYKVTNAAGLVALSGMTINGKEIVTLGADIDLTGVTFNGLNAFNPEQNNTFDGNGYTVSNWTNNSGASDMGFIKNWVGPIKNVKFDNCHLKTSGRSAIVAAKVYGNIENVEVKNSSIEDSYWACGIIAGLYNNGNISNCTVVDSSVKSNGGTAAIVGVINETSGERNVTNCSVTGCTINNTGAYGASYSGGALVGMFNCDNTAYTIEGCTVSNNTLVGAHVYEKYPANENVTEK